LLRTGKAFELLLTIVAIGVGLYYLRKALKGATWEFRRLPALDAISDGVDRAVETGRPVFMSFGAYAYLSGLYAAMTISGVNIARYTYRLCVRKGATPIFILPNNPEVAPLIDGVYRESCVAEGKPEAYRRENIYYFGNDEPAYRTGTLNLLAAMPPATYVLTGAVTGTGDSIALWATRSMDTLLIGGQARHTHQAYMVAFDYGLYLSDVYSAGAILSGDSGMQSTVVAGDVFTWITVILGVGGIILALLGAPFLTWIST
jgi:hypothetical protein